MDATVSEEATVRRLCERFPQFTTVVAFLKKKSSRAKVMAAEAEIRSMVEAASRERRSAAADALARESRDSATVVTGALARDIRRRAAVLTELSARLTKASVQSVASMAAVVDGNGTSAISSECSRINAELSRALSRPPCAADCGDGRSFESYWLGTVRPSFSVDVSGNGSLAALAAVATEMSTSPPCDEKELDRVQCQMLSEVGVADPNSVTKASFRSSIRAIQDERFEKHLRATSDFTKGTHAMDANADMCTGNESNGALGKLTAIVSELESTRERLRSLLPSLQADRDAKEQLTKAVDDKLRHCGNLARLVSLEIARANKARKAIAGSLRRDLRPLSEAASRSLAVPINGSAVQSDIASVTSLDWAALFRRQDAVVRNQWLSRGVASRLDTLWGFISPPNLIEWTCEFLNDFAARNLTAKQRSKMAALLSQRGMSPESAVSITTEIVAACRQHDEVTVAGKWLQTMKEIESDVAESVSLCECVRTLEHEWWVQPAQFALPWLTVDGMPFDQWLSLWREMHTPQL